MRHARAHRIRRIRVGALGVLVALVWMPGAYAQGQGQGPGQGKGPPGTPGEESATNNLSFPVTYVDGELSPPGVQGVSVLDGTYYLWDGQGAPCDPASPDCYVSPDTPYRVYLQKDLANTWQAYSEGLTAPVTATHLDVSDNLESVPWRTTSVVRVEFTPFLETTLQGYEMVYVSGLGVDEVWGVLGQYDDDLKAWQATPEFPGYSTLYSACMALSLTKLEAGAGDVEVEPTFAGAWTPGAYTWAGAAQTIVVDPMTAEINVKGKVLFGYNWFLKRTAMDPGVSKEGWWRLTFYSTCDPASFDLTGTLPYDPMVGPPVETAEEGGAGPSTYPRVPLMDSGYDIVWIDVYIQARTKGGGGGNPNR